MTCETMIPKKMRDYFRSSPNSGRCGNIIGALFLALVTAGAGSATAQTKARLFERIEEVTAVTTPGAHEPSLTSHDGALYLSWMEHEQGQTKVMMAVGSNHNWTEPSVVHQGADLFVNWADFPSIAVYPDNTIAVHWLRKIGPSGFDYRIEIALSHDRGVTWNEPLIPHEDRSLSQHGFVSLLPISSDSMALIWLDGRAYGRDKGTATALPDAMQLRATTLSSDGRLGRDVAIDLQTCSCCQTSLAATREGEILAAYRDRTESEIRDIAVARLTKDGWQTPVRIHDDGWELAGCPVNGPAISTHEDRVAVAWFTGADDIPAVHVAFSDNVGRSFAEPARIDLGNPVGRVDVEMLEDGTAVVSWVEWTNGYEALMVCHVSRETGCMAQEVLATNTGGASMNFPKMARLGRDIFFAWTQPDGKSDSIAMRQATLMDVD